MVLMYKKDFVAQFINIPQIYYIFTSVSTCLSPVYILRRNRNRGGGGIACYIRKDLCLNIRDLNCKKVKNTIFDILLPNLKPITVGVLCRPSNQATWS